MGCEEAAALAVLAEAHRSRTFAAEAAVGQELGLVACLEEHRIPSMPIHRSSTG